MLKVYTHLDKANYCFRVWQFCRYRACGGSAVDREAWSFNASQLPHFLVIWVKLSEMALVAITAKEHKRRGSTWVRNYLHKRHVYIVYTALLPAFSIITRKNSEIFCGWISRRLKSFSRLLNHRSPTRQRGFGKR